MKGVGWLQLWLYEFKFKRKSAKYNNHLDWNLSYTIDRPESNLIEKNIPILE